MNRVNSAILQNLTDINVFQVFYNNAEITFRKIGNFIVASSFAYIENLPHNTIMGILPENFHPPYAVEIPIYRTAKGLVNTHLANMDITPSGQLKIFNLGGNTLETISFRLQAVWLNL